MPSVSGDAGWRAYLGDQHRAADQVHAVPAVFGAVVAAVAVGVVALEAPVRPHVGDEADPMSAGSAGESLCAG